MFVILICYCFLPSDRFNIKYVQIINILRISQSVDHNIIITRKLGNLGMVVAFTLDATLFSCCLRPSSFAATFRFLPLTAQLRTMYFPETFPFCSGNSSIANRACGFAKSNGRLLPWTINSSLNTVPFNFFVSLSYDCERRASRIDRYTWEGTIEIEFNCFDTKRDDGRPSMETRVFTFTVIYGCVKARAKRMYSWTSRWSFIYVLATDPFGCALCMRGWGKRANFVDPRMRPWCTRVRVKDSYLSHLSPTLR